MRILTRIPRLQKGRRGQARTEETVASSGGLARAPESELDWLEEERGGGRRRGASKS